MRGTEGADTASGRRAVLGTVAAGVLAGCTGNGSGSGDGNGDGDGGTPPVGDCDPDDVSRPPIVRDSNHPPTGYATKPMELTAQSVADYLSDFETGYAMNRILDEHDDVTSVGVNTVDGYQPEAAGDGFVSSSRIETHYSLEGSDERTEDDYVTNYYVSAGPVYRVETETDPIDPRERSDRQLVQCGED